MRNHSAAFRIPRAMFALAGVVTQLLNPQAGAEDWVTTQLLVQLTASFLVVVILAVLLAPVEREPA